jgi:2',3'-cyclic-nucleotide 2'-phosphodiesterase (5'-nucleotidase family)
LSIALTRDESPPLLSRNDEPLVEVTARPLPAALPALRFEPQEFAPLEHPDEAKPQLEAPADVSDATDSQTTTTTAPTPPQGMSSCPEPPIPAPPAPAAAPPTPPIPRLPPVEEPLELDLLLFGKIEGDFALIDCRDKAGANNHFAYASQVTLVNTLREAALRQGRLEPIPFNLGDSTFPGALSNFLLSQGEAGATEVATILSKIPYAGMALGNHDFSPPQEDVRRFFKSAAHARLPVLGANVRCTTPEADASLCALLGTSEEGGRPYRFIRRGPLNIGVTALIDPRVTSQIAKDRLEGIELLEPVEVLKRLVPQMRAQGANLIIVLFHIAGSQTTNALEPLINEIEGLDLMITDRLFAIDEEPLAAHVPALRQMGHMVLPRTQTFVLGAGSSANGATRATLRLRRDGERFLLEQISPRYISTGILDPEPGTARRLEGAASAFCDEWGGPLRPGTELAQAFDIFDMAEFILNTLRFTVNAELAFMNARAFRNPEQFPLTDTLTQADVFSTLPFGSRLVKARLPGEQLERLAPHLGEEILGVGLSKNQKGELEVNGRPLDKKRHYVVALNEFLAEGSGGFLEQKKIEEVTFYRDPVTHQEPTLAWIVSDAVRDARFTTPDGSFRLSPKENFPDLHRQLLWKLGGSLNAAYSQMDIVNPSGADGAASYDKSRLTAVATDVLNLELKLLANAESRDHGWDSDLLLQYATTRLKGEADSHEFEETKDVLRLRSAYKHLGLRSALGSRWYVPVPYTELQMESQLTQDATMTWHPLEMTSIVGLLLRLTSTLEFKMGLNIRGDLNAPKDEPMIGLFTGYQLTKTNLFELASRPVQFESEFEYFFNADGHDRLHELRWANKIYFAITGALSLTGNFNMYIYRTKSVGEVGRATEAMLGLNVALEKMIQMF